MRRIVKVYRESLPRLRFIGKRYTDKDAAGHPAGFASKWVEWFENGWFAPLEALPHIPRDGDAYVALMRKTGDGFGYSIGMFCEADTPVPAGYTYQDLDASDVGVVWIQGNERNGEIYVYGDEEMDALRANNLFPAGTWYAKRYVCPRFTRPDENGEVILDLLVWLQERI